ncbi:hypothetical protein ACS0TY_001929 [Phlomoides rotata]
MLGENMCFSENQLGLDGWPTLIVTILLKASDVQECLAEEGLGCLLFLKLTSKCKLRLQMNQTRVNRSLRAKCFKQAGPSYSYRRKEVGSLSWFL